MMRRANAWLQDGTTSASFWRRSFCSWVHNGAMRLLVNLIATAVVIAYMFAGA